MASLKQVAEELRAVALAYPEVYEENPWGHRVVKVANKIFAFIDHGKSFTMTVKLPQSQPMALEFPFAAPTHYGMGKHGWVTCTFQSIEEVPKELLLEWLDESFRAIAPKKLLKALDEGGLSKQEKPALAATGKALLIGDDKLRIDRARKALEQAGLTVEKAPLEEEALGRAAEASPDVIVIDLGRRSWAGLQLAKQFGRSELEGTPLVFAGSATTVTTQDAKKVSGQSGVFREAPGDPKVVAGIVLVLGVATKTPAKKAPAKKAPAKKLAAKKAPPKKKKGASKSSSKKSK